MKPELTHDQDYQMRCLITHGIKADLPMGNPYHYIAFDPGEGTGWATFAENGMPTDYGNIYGDVRGIYDFLHGGPRNGIGTSLDMGIHIPKVVIYEKWKLLKTKEFYGSTLLSVQVVGIIRGWAQHIEAELISNETNLNTGNQKQSGIEPKGSHSQSHWTFAFNHGWHHLNEIELVIPRLLWPEG